LSAMRIAFDARSLSSPVLRGWDRYTIGLVRALTRRGVEVTLLCRASAPVHASHAATLGVPVLPLADRGGLWWEQVALPGALRRGAFDVYHAPAEHGVPLLAPCPTVLTLHSATAHSYADLIRAGKLPGTLSDYVGDADPGRFSFANAYWKAQVARAGHIIAPSRFAAEEIVRLVPADASRVSAIPLAADDIFHGPPRGRAALDDAVSRAGIARPYLLHVGGFDRHKNVDGLIAAFALVRAARPDLSLLIIGSGAVPSELAGRALTESGIHLLSGVVQDLPALYEAAELYVSLSWRESFGLPALEAMTRGTAVVASAWGAAPEVVGDGGILVDPRDHQAFAAAVSSLLGDHARHDRARAAASRFDWDRVAAQTIRIYESVR
jgi:glycosyltransferase involved in cell wall biosynthesis